MVQQNNIEEFVFAYISKYGEKELTMDIVARELRISKQSIYKLFPSKNVLVVSSTKSAFEAFLTKINRTFKVMPNPMSAIVFVAVDSLVFFCNFCEDFLKTLSTKSELKELYEQTKHTANSIGEKFVTDCYAKGYIYNMADAKSIADKFFDTLMNSKEYKESGSLTKNLAFEIVINRLLEVSTKSGREVLLELRENYA